MAENNDLQPGGHQPKTADNSLARGQVALYVSGGEIMSKAWDQVVALAAPKGSFQVFTKISELLEAILAGQFCGVIALHRKLPASVESVLRHDLKNLPGWDKDRADRHLLPPCVDLEQGPRSFVEVMIPLSQMLAGEYRANPKTFSLIDELPALGTRMARPKRILKVVLVDDDPDEAIALYTILMEWPGLETVFVHAQGNSVEVATKILEQRPDIVLLDEDMGEARGEQVHQLLDDIGCTAMVVSTTGGFVPQHVTQARHFGLKSKVGESFEIAEDFILLMNRLIRFVTRD